MAPVKRVAASAQRETRSTRASTIVKKTASSANKIVSPISKKKATAAVKATGAVARKTRKDADEQTIDYPPPQDETIEDIEVAEAKSQRGKSIKSASTKLNVTKPDTKSRSLAAAPRRRIKITPLDTFTEPAVKDEAKSVRSKSKTSTAVKKTGTRSQKVAEEAHEDDDCHMQDAPEHEATKSRTTRKTSAKPQDEQNAETKAPIKTRGRPKKVEPQEHVQAGIDEHAPAPSTRATRTRQAASIVAQQSRTLDDAENLGPSSLTVAARKKVTFQGVPDENDKENQPLPSKSRKSTTSKGDKSSLTTGLRAKPLRKPAAPSAKVRGRKTAADTDKSSVLEDENEATKKNKKPRALTPKKITQVAKSGVPVEDEDEGMSDGLGEDELSGSKTPVRDLSVSPRRPLNPALGRAISPVKRLDFSQELTTQITTRHEDGERKGHDGALASPARRPPTSPFKDALKDSPKRGDGMKLLFPTHNQSQTDVHASLALNSSNIASASQTMPTLLQSPKRNGILDASLFSQSAMKNSSVKSPFKASLLASPARRLFSPAKRPATAALSKISELLSETQESEQEQEAKETVHDEQEDDVTVSSHFRASSSPLRVHLAENNNGNIDFDDSVLEVRSPLKVQKSPFKKQQSLVDDQGAQTELRVPTPAKEGGSEEESEERLREDDQIIDPLQLSRVSDIGAAQPVDEVDTSFVEHNSNVGDNALISPEHEKATDASSPLSALTSSHENAASTKSDRALPHGQYHSRNADSQDDTETSEDELATDETPVRSLTRTRVDLSAKNNHSRLSVGISRSAATKGFGFTPLAAQMNGWQAGSPEKTPIPRPMSIQRQGSFEFSPLAGQHVDGEVIVSRDSTPVQKLNLRKSLASASSSKSANKSGQSLGLRRSMAQRKSLDPGHHQSFDESPERNAQFEEYMEMRAMEEEADAVHEDTEDRSKELQCDLDSDIGNFDEGSDEGDDTILVDDVGREGHTEQSQSGELTTDLVNFTNASETAMVDFLKLAQEAEELAPAMCETEDNQGESHQEIMAHHDADMIIDEVSSPALRAITSDLNSPSVLVIDEDQNEAEKEVTDDLFALPSVSITPARLPLDYSQARMINTVVSKVPLKPEGAISPIKVQRKRARSFGNAEASSNKRISFGDLKEVVIASNDTIEQSPDRRVRTSTAPSPGGTSTPASRYARSSFGGMSSVTTPGQMSFIVDDFGDSTLDGIELPEDCDDNTQMQYDHEAITPAVTERNYDADVLPETPRSTADATPLASKNSTHRATTPATSKKTPVTATKNASTRKSIGIKSERKPLKPVNAGILDGTVVFVDVHTSEGADASGIFVELLTQMGARCVKEWRWNSKASLAVGTESDDIEQRIGITHVVYKDGGKRTLEKVRDAKGEVLCVGVAWVLDCERQSKWLDEANYAIDTTVVPRGGSNRRKSMEPRALLHNGDGSLSTSRPRRSVSAEMSEMMKQELIKTPVRNHLPQSTPSEPVDENEIDDGDEGSPQDQATPTGYISYDPRTAMTPGTPYLISQGKKLVQMSAPPKQTGKRLFDHEDNDEPQETEARNVVEDVEEEEKLNGTGIGNGNEAVKKDAKKFRMRNLDSKIRRRTVGFKPVVGSPLAK